MSPVDPVTPHEAARILGCSTSTVRRRVKAGVLTGSERPLRLSRADMERLARDWYQWDRCGTDRFSYWVLDEQAAEILGLPLDRFLQLADSRRVPFVVHRDGTRLFRRAQLVGAVTGRRTTRSTRRTPGRVGETPRNGLQPQ